ncbi:MAG: DJ-1/PfpI family protein [Dysgonamonadaceae bacterium]|nr:DJ-1/PfpI family protein [Dysgonamonadaceae bacterium]
MKKVAVFLAQGFEEIEALSIIDILRRTGVEVTTVSITTYNMVRGAHNVKVDADEVFEYVDFSEMDMLVLPGGMPGAKNLNNSEDVRKWLKIFASEGKEIAAICAAPMVLGDLGLLEGKNATCYPGFEAELKGANVTGESVVVDGNITTGKGPGLAFDFALALVEKLCGVEKRNEVASGLLLV